MFSPEEDDWHRTNEARASALSTTKKHVQRVRELLDMAAGMLSVRGAVHDQSKFEEVEIGPLTEMQKIIDRDGQAPYGSEEYKRRTAMLGPMLEHHYANNSHHPEHYDDGVDGMCLFDVVEMFFDWKAASERGDEPAMNITVACERFRVSPQLERVFQNTAERLSYKHQ
jgi:hypothetical protein